MQVSNIARSADWIKASYESERDNLLDFGLEEVPGAVSGGLQLQGLKMEGVKVD